MDTEEPENDDAEYFMLPISYLIDMAQGERLDPALRAIIDAITRPHSRYEAMVFALHNDILCRRNFGPVGSPWLLVIPKHLRSDILQELHDALSPGHLGVLQAYTRLKAQFYFPGM